MFGNYYYALRNKELEVRSIWAKLRRVHELESLVVWAKRKKLTDVERNYRSQLLQTEDKLLWQTRNHRVLLELCRCGLELYNQLVPKPKFYRPGSASSYKRSFEHNIRMLS